MILFVSEEFLHGIKDNSAEGRITSIVNTKNKKNSFGTKDTVSENSQLATGPSPLVLSLACVGMH